MTILKVVTAFLNLINAILGLKKVKPVELINNNQQGHNITFKNNCENNVINTFFNHGQLPTFHYKEVYRIPLMFKGRQLTTRTLIVVGLLGTSAGLSIVNLLDLLPTSLASVAVKSLVLAPLLILCYGFMLIQNEYQRLGKTQLAVYDGLIYKVDYQCTCPRCGGNVEVGTSNRKTVGRCEIDPRHISTFSIGMFDQTKYQKQ